MVFFQICACTAAFFTVTHSVGHIFNFYHVVTQPVERLMCLFEEVSFPPDHEKPDMTFWLMGTVAGSTGLLLYAVSSVIYVFAHPSVRDKGYNCFWFTHQVQYLLPPATSPIKPTVWHINKKVSRRNDTTGVFCFINTVVCNRFFMAFLFSIRFYESNHRWTRSKILEGGGFPF